MVWDAHNRIKHLGEQQTLADIRFCYWVPRGNSFVKKILHWCLICRKFNLRQYSYPNSPNLPNVRVNHKIAFYGTGVDYLGPLYCKANYDMNSFEDDYGLFKCYVVLHTCASTRGVVLELVLVASSKNFVYGFRKFIARRGCPGEVLCDNGTVFTSQETQEFASNRNISWKFNLTNASWYGGFWERLVSVVKRCLKKTAGKPCLNFYELQIILFEIELILNSRPLNQLCDDDTSDILTPNHLYQINPNFKHSYEEFQIDIPKRVKHVENTIEHF